MLEDIKNATIDNVNQAIEWYKNHKFPKYTEDTPLDKYVDNTQKILSDKFGFCLWPSLILDNSKFQLKIFRAREFDSFNNVNLIREHSYPPISITKAGRCNFPKLPVFYSSDNPTTALFEAIKASGKPNAKYCISKWTIKESNDTLAFQSFMDAELPKDNPFYEFGQMMRNKVDEPFIKEYGKPLSKENSNGILEYLKFMHNAFLNDNDYTISAFFAYQSLFINHKLRTDILMYPSVAANRLGINLAMNPNFVENNLELEKLFIVSIGNYNKEEKTIEYTLYNYAEVEKNIIIWKKPSDLDKSYAEIAKEIFG